MVMCVFVYVYVCMHDCSDDDMQSLASLMSLQQKEGCTDSCDATDDVNVSDVANMADVADEEDVQTCQPILSDIRQLVSRFSHKLFTSFYLCNRNIAV